MHAAPASPGLLIYRIKRTVKFGNTRLVRLVVEVIVQILGIEQEFVPVPGIDRLCRLLAVVHHLHIELHVGPLLLRYQTVEYHVVLRIIAAGQVVDDQGCIHSVRRP